MQRDALPVSGAWRRHRPAEPASHENLFSGGHLLRWRRRPPLGEHPSGGDQKENAVRQHNAQYQKDAA